MGKDNRDPWVYEFSTEALKDIKYDTSRPAAASLAQAQKGFVAPNPYMAENVYDFTRNYTTPTNIFPRAAAAPTTAEV